MTDTKTVKTTATFKDVYFYYTSVNTPQKQLNPDGKPVESEHPLEVKMALLLVRNLSLSHSLV